MDCPPIPATGFRRVVLDGLVNRRRLLSPNSLERNRLDDAHQQFGRTAVVPLKTLHQPIDGLDVIIPEPAPECIRQQFLAQTTIEIALPLG